MEGGGGGTLLVYTEAVVLVSAAALVKPQALGNVTDAAGLRMMRHREDICTSKLNATSDTRKDL